MTEPSPLPPEESVPEDDVVIARAFRISLAVILVLAAAGSGVWYFGQKSEEKEPIREKQVGEIANLETPEVAELPRIPFRDITAEAGIDFRHENGAFGRKWLPETMGSGAAFLDYDLDGDPDLLLVNGDHWPERRQAGADRPTSRLYRNDGSGRFTDVTESMGLDISIYGVGVAVGDYDGDGDPDVFLTALGPNVLLRNDGDRFRDVTETAGLAGDAAAWSSSAGFFDADGDGDLDLFVCNYVEWSREIDDALGFTLNGKDRAYGPPTNFQGFHPSLYRNEGDGRFTDVSAESGIPVANRATGKPVAKALAVCFVDVDGEDGLDIVVANDTTQNFLYRNRGDGSFEEVGSQAGVAFSLEGRATGAMGVDAAHYRNDPCLGIAVGNFANEMTSFFVCQDRRLYFSDDAVVEGIGSPSRLALTFGLFFFDADLDGWLDLLQTNGHLEEEISTVQPSQSYRQPAQLFWNQGIDAAACYVELDRELIEDLALPIVGRGAAYADIDADGDLDVLLTQVAGPPLLLRNEQTTGHHWLRVRLRGRAPNTEAIGARVVVESGGIRQERAVMPTRSYLCQVELPVTFGLGPNTSVDSLTVHWPDGSSQTIPVTEVDREIEVVQP